MRHTLTGPSGRQQKGNCFVVLLVCLAAQKKAKEEAGAEKKKGGGSVYKVADLTCDTFCQESVNGPRLLFVVAGFRGCKALRSTPNLGQPALSVCVCVYIRVCVHKSQMPLHT